MSQPPATPLERLRQGQPPGDPGLIEDLSVGIDFITDFWREKYLDEYIAQGGSKIKFLTGTPGSGKSHCMELFTRRAEQSGYITVNISAKQTWIHDFKEIYAAALAQADMPSLLKKCADDIITSLGYDPADIPEGLTFTDYLSHSSAPDPLAKREIRLRLSETFIQNPYMDNNFALSCSLLTGGILGHPMLEEHNRQLLLLWLAGDKTVKLHEIRKLGLSPGRISKLNARHMLRSLIEVVKAAGYKGLLICVDDLETLISKSGLTELRYTKMRREDAYESIRELIDAIDTLRSIMFIFAFDNALLDNENDGIKSYQALWIRIQNEIEGERFNRFADIVDLDKLARQQYGVPELTEMSRRLSAALSTLSQPAAPIGEDAAQRLIAESKHGQASLPRRVNALTVGGNGEA